MLKKMLIISLSLLIANKTFSAAEPRFPLHDAAQNGDSAAVQELLGHCDPNEQDNNGRTPLHCAAQNGQYQVFHLLLAHLANQDDVNLANFNGQTALHLAAEFSYEPEPVQALLDHGANIDATDRWGLTPLHYAAQYGHHASVQVLLQRGAHSAARSAGRRPLDLANNLHLLSHPSTAARYVKGCTPLDLTNSPDVKCLLINNCNLFKKILRALRACSSSLLLAHHPRCGANSALRELPPFTLQQILSYLKQGNCIYTREEVEQLVKSQQQNKRCIIS